MPANGAGYLLASSQGSDKYAVYRREGNNNWVMTFKIGVRNGIDDVTVTDGIDVTNFNLGPNFPQGVFVAQDGHNDDGHQNYKLVPWQAIANRVNPPLIIDTSWDPRQVGAGGTLSTPMATPAPRLIYLPIIMAKSSVVPEPAVGIWISSDEEVSLRRVQ